MQPGEPALADVDGAGAAGELVTVLACGLCGSDVEKIGLSAPGTVLGHEVVALTADGRRVALIHHAGCGAVPACLGGHESTCEQFPEPTIVPGGFAERVRAAGWVELPASVPDAVGTYVEPLACVLRGAERVPRGRVLVVGNGFIGRLFGAVLERRGDTVFAVDRLPQRAGVAPDGPVDAAVLCAPGGGETALGAVEPGGTVLLFADAGTLPADGMYRRELTVIGSRSATPATWTRPWRCCPTLDLPEPTVVPLERFEEALALFGRAALKVVLVLEARPGRLKPRPLRRRVRALIFHGPGDLRLEDVPRPEPDAAGDVLVQVEVALTDGTDLKAFRRGHPVLLGPPPSPFGHEFCGVDVATGRRVVAANSAPCGACAACRRAARRRSARTCSLSSTARTPSSSSCPSASPATTCSRSRRGCRRSSRRWSSRSPAACTASRRRGSRPETRWP